MIRFLQVGDIKSGKSMATDINKIRYLPYGEVKSGKSMATDMNTFC